MLSRESETNVNIEGDFYYNSKERFSLAIIKLKASTFFSCPSTRFLCLHLPFRTLSRLRNSVLTYDDYAPQIKFKFFLPTFSLLLYKGRACVRHILYTWCSRRADRILKSNEKRKLHVFKGERVRCTLSTSSGCTETYERNWT